MNDPEALGSAIAGTSFCGIWSCMMCFYILMMLVSLAGVVFWIFMLIDVIKRDDKDFGGKSDNQKLIWILVMVFTSYIGSAIYYFMVYKKEGKAK